MRTGGTVVCIHALLYLMKGILHICYFVVYSNLVVIYVLL